jgi:hypothetical protein
VSLGTEVNVLPAAIEAVRARGGLVIAQLTRGFSTPTGTQSCPAMSSTTRWTRRRRCLPRPERPATESSAVIGHRVARSSATATLQAGIGAVPDAVLAPLAGTPSRYRRPTRSGRTRRWRAGPRGLRSVSEDVRP